MATKDTINDLKFKYFSREVGQLGTLQDLKFHYYSMRLGG